MNSTPQILGVNNWAFSTSGTEFTHRGHKCNIALFHAYSHITDHLGGFPPYEDVGAWVRFFEIDIEIGPGLHTGFMTCDARGLLSEEEFAFWLEHSQPHAYGDEMDFGAPYDEVFCQCIGLMIDRFFAWRKAEGRPFTLEEMDAWRAEEVAPEDEEYLGDFNEDDILLDSQFGPEAA
jgi:hypothetical protein